jgi:hypothetical protein
MPDKQNERSCLHRIMVQLIDDFFAEFPPTPGEADKVSAEEADEVLEAIAKTVTPPFFAST